MSNQDLFFQTTDSASAKKLEAVNEELRKAEAQKSKLSGDLMKANGALSSAEGECAKLKSKLKELEKHLSAVDASKELEAKLQVGWASFAMCAWVGRFVFRGFLEFCENIKE